MTLVPLPPTPNGMRKTAKTFTFCDPLVDISQLYSSTHSPTGHSGMRKTTSLKVSFGNTLVIQGAKCKSPASTQGKSILWPAIVHCLCPKAMGPTKSALKVQPPKTTSPCSTAQVQGIMPLKRAFPNSFNTTGNMSETYTIRTDPNDLPVQHTQKKVPTEYREQIKHMLHYMVKKAVTAPVSSLTEWVSLLTYPHKPDGTLHICLDPKDLNKAIL